MVIPEEENAAPRLSIEFGYRVIQEATRGVLGGCQQAEWMQNAMQQSTGTCYVGLYFKPQHRNEAAHVQVKQV